MRFHVELIPQAVRRETTNETISCPASGVSSYVTPNSARKLTCKIGKFKPKALACVYSRGVSFFNTNITGGRPAGRSSKSDPNAVE